ncbi:IS66 family insertion sequence element accessory protein TnpB, partial [Thomasclavelia cocleata]
YGRNTKIMKALYWEGDGFFLLYKRLENGKFKWPRDEFEAREITSQQFRWLLEGGARIKTVPGKWKN